MTLSRLLVAVKEGKVERLGEQRRLGVLKKMQPKLLPGIIVEYLLFLLKDYIDSFVHFIWYLSNCIHMIDSILNF